MLLDGEAKEVNYIFMASELFQKLYLYILRDMQFIIFIFSLGKFYSNAFLFVGSLHDDAKLAISNNAARILNQL